MTLFSHIWRGPIYHSPALRRWSQTAQTWSAHRAIAWLLFALGLARALVSLLAYPPAHGADSFAYLFYAERLAGLDIPGLSQLVPPLYSTLLLVSVKLLGSAYWLIGLQALMSAALAPLYYLALRRFSPPLALLAALVILLDFQVATTFNFLSTEPLYIFLLALTFYLFLRQAERTARSPSAGDALAGVLLVLVMLTRAVGRFLIIPLALLFWLRTRSWKRTLTLAAGFGISLLLYSLLSQTFLGGVEGTSSSDYMVTGVVLRNKQWLTAENGAASAEFLGIQEACQGKGLNFYDCYLDQRGSWDGMLPLIINTTLETVSVNWLPYARDVWTRTNDFLSLSGQQLGYDEGVPSDVQCQSARSDIENLTPETTLQRGWGWTWGIRSFVEEEFEQFQSLYGDMRLMLCPPLPASAPAKEVVDYLMFRYRSLGRPQPYLYYGALILLVIALPWARRCGMIVWTAGAALLYHALISAVINNVQPRYVVVTNPFRAVLLVTLAVIVLKLGLLAADWALNRWRKDETNLPPETAARPS